MRDTTFWLLLIFIALLFAWFLISAFKVMAYKRKAREAKSRFNFIDYYKYRITPEAKIKAALWIYFCDEWIRMYNKDENSLTSYEINSLQYFADRQTAEVLKIIKENKYFNDGKETKKSI